MLPAANSSGKRSRRRTRRERKARKRGSSAMSGRVPDDSDRAAATQPAPWVYLVLLIYCALVAVVWALGAGVSVCARAAGAGHAAAKIRASAIAAAPGAVAKDRNRPPAQAETKAVHVVGPRRLTQPHSSMRDRSPDCRSCQPQTPHRAAQAAFQAPYAGVKSRSNPARLPPKPRIQWATLAPPSSFWNDLSVTPDGKLTRHQSRSAGVERASTDTRTQQFDLGLAACTE